MGNLKNPAYLCSKVNFSIFQGGLFSFKKGRGLLSMPGVLGFYCKNKGDKEQNASLINTMIRAMLHENDYLINSYIDDYTSIGRISLGVINCDSQPVWSEDNRYCVFMDGQIFDYNQKKQELIGNGYIFKKNSEEEVVAFMFQEYGQECVKYLKGIFIIVVWDTFEKNLYLINDRYGYRIVYYYDCPDKFIFASEIKAILATELVKKELDENALCDMINFHFIMGNKTFFTNIKILQPGSIYKVKSTKSNHSKYWSYPADVVYSNSEIDTLIEKGHFLIKKSVLQHLKGDLNIGVTLSGGLDSRIISAVLEEEDVPFTLLHFGNKSWGETKIANEVATILGREMIHFDSLALDFLKVIKEGSFVADGQFASEQYTYLELLEKVKKMNGVNFVFHGLALDILFGGPFMLLKDDDFYSQKDIVLLIRDRYRIFPEYLGRHLFKHNFAHRLNQMSEESIGEQIKGFPKKNYAQLGNYFYLNNRGRRYVLGTPFVNNRYVEYAFPGLDYDLYDFAIEIPKSLRAQRDLYREIFMRYFSELSQTRYSGTNLPLNKWPTAASKRRTEYKKKCFYYISRLTSGKLDFHQPAISLDKRFRKDSKFRKSIIDYLKKGSPVLEKYLNFSGLDYLLREESSGKNYFDVFHSLISIQLFFEQYTTDKDNE